MFLVQEFSKNVKRFRTLKGISQHGLAAALGVSPQTVSKWECGRGVPDIENLCLLAQLLGVSVDALLDGSLGKKKIMIGIDGGGSKTEFLLFTEDGMILGRALRGGCSPTIIGLEACADLLADGIEELLAVHSGVSAVFVGSAGFYTDKNGEKVKDLLCKRFPRLEIECRSDIVNVIFAAACETDCLAAICGTGSSVFCWEKEELSLFTGWGYMFDKYGSGYAIGRDALTAALEASVGLKEKSALTDAVEEKLGVPVGDAIGKIYREGVSFVASFAPAVFEAYERGDHAAREILEANAAHLGYMITEAARRTPSARSVIISGGLVTSHAVYADMLEKRIPKGLSLIIGDLPQCIGACLGAAAIAGVKSAALRDALRLAYAENRASKSIE